MYQRLFLPQDYEKGSDQDSITIKKTFYAGEQKNIFLPMQIKNELPTLQLRKNQLEYTDTDSFLQMKIKRTE